MDSTTQMSCMMKMNVHCDGCKRKIMEVLQNLKGVYSMVLDAEQGTVKVNGKVNPTTILHIFDKYGKHGEVSSVRFDGEVMDQIPYSFYGENPYMPYEMPYPPVPYPFFGAEHQLYGRNQYLTPMPPPLLGPLPPPPRPPPPTQQQPQPLPPPTVSKAPSAPPAPPPPHPKCCTIM